MSEDSPKKSQKKVQKTYAVRISVPDSQRGRYLRFRTGTDSHGKVFLREDFVGNMEDASRYVRFDDAREKALEKKRENPSLEVSVAEISGKVLGRFHPVKLLRRDFPDAE